MHIKLATNLRFPPSFCFAELRGNDGRLRQGYDAPFGNGGGLVVVAKVLG